MSSIPVATNEVGHFLVGDDIVTPPYTVILERNEHSSAERLCELGNAPIGEEFVDVEDCDIVVVELRIDATNIGKKVGGGSCGSLSRRYGAPPLVSGSRVGERQDKTPNGVVVDLDIKVRSSYE